MTAPRNTFALALLLIGCSNDVGAEPPAPSVAAFRDSVYPVLLRDCGFPACHGNRDRFFRVFGPGRTRIEGVALSAPLSDDEVDASYDRARSMLSGASRAADTLLLRKPLEIEQGGAPHMGVDHRGRDVYGSTDDAGYEALRAWVAPSFPEETP